MHLIDTVSRELRQPSSTEFGLEPLDPATKRSSSLSAWRLVPWKVRRTGSTTRRR